MTNKLRGSKNVAKKNANTLKPFTPNASNSNTNPSKFQAAPGKSKAVDTIKVDLEFRSPNITTPIQQMYLKNSDKKAGSFLSPASKNRSSRLEFDAFLSN